MSFRRNLQELKRRVRKAGDRVRVTTEVNSGSRFFYLARSGLGPLREFRSGARPAFEE
jgi:hypothetical protein